MQRDDVLLEVQRAVVVGVERAEDVLGVAGGVALREEAGVDLLELLRADAARGTLLLEVLVPLADLGLRELGVELQVLQDLLGDRAAGGVSHGAGLDCLLGISPPLSCCPTGLSPGPCPGPYCALEVFLYRSDLQMPCVCTRCVFSSREERRSLSL